ncbi:MAG: type II toxin-antitoxin system PemK/MazF family toxin [Acidobacteria bacterium]|nr:type II toxin-antitoxin system PemK/MazF family toxin [Acidobacteriota bacterium]MBI3261663.1 type II toxin-antitoxin system PemK/MazF family toxin [Acidobacteriota bacterium]
MIPRRGDVYLVSFDPALGAEIQKTRPALVVQNDIGNEHSPLTIVAAVTSNLERRGPTSVVVDAPEGGFTVDSVILLNQIRTIDKRRLGRRLGALHRESMRRVDQAMMISLGLLNV